MFFLLKRGRVVVPEVMDGLTLYLRCRLSMAKMAVVLLVIAVCWILPRVDTFVSRLKRVLPAFLRLLPKRQRKRMVL
jgi:hypothetical protein